ncbi:twin-arginine translocase subunit TatC [Rhizosphaericola mali]|jgi:sec-independent protein translocase protein TatC|uniref:Sec-independent protein translocase protein TatC n=1 Tax=Rhizosphaericola mali TaxID=2545455 RepID=A0A5P2G307_9BACT|nr:twin-arginine translocase subunit TatC [Rhizosphaericola mali]QES90204.1 twin-arginine translocase subunit TatC [Rhizosphaericola mali]
MINDLFQRGGDSEKAEMSFVDHLEALRWHIVRSILAILVFAVIIFIKIHWVTDYILFGPLNPDFVSYTGFCKFSHFIHAGDAFCLPPIKVNMQANTFGTQFIGSFTIAILGGFIAAFPYIFWEFWKFVKPALKPNELKNTRFAIFWVSFFFFLGAAFGYFVLSPFTFNFLASFQLSNRNMILTIPTLDDYISNMTNIILGCGIAFEMPVLAFVLTKIGLITPKFLKTYRKYAIVVILVVAAVITPSPDWISQMLVFLPLISLYEISVFVSKRVYKEEKQKELEEWS